jgi:hypothetical protein
MEGEEEVVVDGDDEGEDAATWKRRKRGDGR